MIMIGFTTPCFILENNSDIRNKLINLGYKLCECYKISFEPKMICCTPDGKFHLTNDSNIITDIWGDLGANCGKNEDLFLAIAALRDDSDIYQWFTDGEKWVKSDIHNLVKFKEYFEEIGFDYHKTHKATVEELIKYFTK